MFRNILQIFLGYLNIGKFLKRALGHVDSLGGNVLVADISALDNGLISHCSIGNGLAVVAGFSCCFANALASNVLSSYNYGCGESIDSNSESCQCIALVTIMLLNAWVQ